jgi:ATP-dependent helicase/DNAse subunit B
LTELREQREKYIEPKREKMGKYFHRAIDQWSYNKKLEDFRKYRERCTRLLATNA